VGRACGTHGRGEKRTGFWWESLKKRPLGRPRHRRKNGIKTGLREIGGGVVEWIHLAADRDHWQALVNAVVNLRVLVPQSLTVIGILTVA
jgi:hypothetical protein